MRKLTLLLVDDSLVFRQAARDLLAALPRVAGVACAASGAEALAKLDAVNPDVVLTDLSMPEMSGFELMRKVRAGDAPPRVYAVTLHDGAEYRAAALRSGAEGLISKREFHALAPPLIASLADAGGV